MSSLAAHGTSPWDGNVISLGSIVIISITNWSYESTTYEMTVLDERHYSNEDGSIGHKLLLKYGNGPDSEEMSLSMEWRNGTVTLLRWPIAKLSNYPDMLRSGKSVRILSIDGHSVTCNAFMKRNDVKFHHIVQEAERQGKLAPGDSYRLISRRNFLENTMRRTYGFNKIII